MHQKQFVSPSEVAGELDVSTTTVLRLIHSGALPAIRVSERIYRIPVASFELYKTDGLRDQPSIQLRPVAEQPRLGESEDLPKPHRVAATAGR